MERSARRLANRALVAALVLAVACACSSAGTEPGNDRTPNRPAQPSPTTPRSPTAGADALPGLIDGVEIESHDHVPPMRDGNGNLYRVTEDYLEKGNRPRVVKSTDGGATWIEQDADNRPTRGDTEGGWALQDGPTIWFAWQGSSTVYLTRFRTSDHPAGPDRYEIQTEIVAAPSDPGPQYASLAKNADGSLWIAHGDTPSDDEPRSALTRREPGGGYSDPMVIDPDTATTAPRLVNGSADITHVFYKDHTHDRVYWRTLSTSGELSAPIRVDTAGTHATETPITNAVRYDVDGVEVLVIAFADPAGMLRSVAIRDGVVGPEQMLSASPVLIDPGETTSLAAVAHLAVAGTVVVATWSDAASGDVHMSLRPDGAEWEPPSQAVDTGADADRQVQYVYGDVFEMSAGRAVFGFTYDLGPHPDDASNIFYDELELTTQ